MDNRAFVVVLFKTSQFDGFRGIHVSFCGGQLCLLFFEAIRFKWAANY